MKRYSTSLILREKKVKNNSEPPFFMYQVCKYFQVYNIQDLGRVWGSCALYTVVGAEIAATFLEGNLVRSFMI